MITEINKFINNISMNKNNIDDYYNIKYKNISDLDDKFQLRLSFVDNYIFHELIYNRKHRTSFIAINKQTNEYKFIKIIEYNNSNGYDEQIKQIILKSDNELKKNIILHDEFYIKKNYFIYIYKFVYNVGFDYYIKINRNELKLKNLFYNIIKNIKLLHDNSIIHNDLKLDNIIIQDDTPYIIDFDLSIIIDNGCIIDKKIGTNKFIAPESNDLCIYSKKSDIWSLGVILYYMICLEYPFKDNDDLEFGNNIILKKNLFKYPDLNYLEEQIKNNGYSIYVYYLIKDMLNFIDDERPNCEDILEYEWFK